MREALVVHLEEVKPCLEEVLRVGAFMGHPLRFRARIGRLEMLRLGLIPESGRLTPMGFIKLNDYAWADCAFLSKISLRLAKPCHFCPCRIVGRLVGPG